MRKTTSTLSVPPDSDAALASDGRYLRPPAAAVSVSATAYQAAAATPTTCRNAPAIVLAGPRPPKDMRIVRAGQPALAGDEAGARAAVPQLRLFWQENGFKPVVDEPTGVDDDRRAPENRAVAAGRQIRNTIGKVFDQLTRPASDKVPAPASKRNGRGGSEVYISHRGMEEVLIGANTRDYSKWTPRSLSTPQLEAQFLSLDGPGFRRRRKITARAGARSRRRAPPRVASVDVPPRALPPAWRSRCSSGLSAWRRAGSHFSTAAASPSRTATAFNGL